MAGFLWYKDTSYIDGVDWNQFAVSELVEVGYTDEVYKPATFDCVVQNVSAGGGLSQSSIAHTGAQPTVVSKTGHGLSTTDRITVTEESTGAILPRIYEIEKINDDTFYLRHFSVNPWSGQKQTGSEVNRINGYDTGAGTLSYVPTGKYSIESASVSTPDLTMGQEIIYWHMPDEYTLGGPYTHDGESPLVAAHVGHGYANGKVLQVLNESTGAIKDGEYQVSNKTTDSYRLKHVKSGEELDGISSTDGSFNTYDTTYDKMYPLFFGTITSLEETWNSSYGKVIKIQARDHLQFLSNTTAKKIQKKFRITGEKIGNPFLAAVDQSGYRMTGNLDPLVYLDGLKIDGSDDPTETKISDAIKNLVDDFNEGAGLVHTDNRNSPTGTFQLQKFQDSSFVMSNEELQSGQFKRDLSDSGTKVLRAMQEMAMSDRHVTVAGAIRTLRTWNATTSSVVVTSAGHGLTTGQKIAVSNSSVGAGDVYIPNGYYTVEVIGTTTFYLVNLEGSARIEAAGTATGTLSWEGAEDGNFGYDYYLDSGIYGQPNENGYTTAGGTTNYAPRAHLNYFKRGYLQFRPDATGLNIIAPVEEDTEETGQIRIMYPNASWTIGDDEIISDVDLQVTGNDDGDTDANDMGHSLQLIRVKKLQCCNNVDAFSTHAQRLNYGGRWNGEFHWNRHDSFTAKDITSESPVYSKGKYECQVGANDEAMFCRSTGTLAAPGFSDDSTTNWATAVIGSAADNWGIDTGPGGGYAAPWSGNTTEGLPYPALGSVANRELLRRVMIHGMGGLGDTGDVISSPVAAYAGYAICGYAGPSQVPLTGRAIRKAPSEPATVKEYPDNDPDVGTTFTEKQKKENPHRWPLYDTGVVDCDLIKSILHCEEEGLIENRDYPALDIDHANASTFTGDAGGGTSGDIIITHNNGAVHEMQTGNIIRITGGHLHDPTNWWNNYKRVSMDGLTSATDFPINTSYPSAGVDTGTGIHEATKFYITNLPNEAYEGISGTVPTPSTTLPKIAYTSGSTITYRRVFNVFDGACRVQYQSSKTRNESADTDTYVLVSDRIRRDVPYMGVDVPAIAEEDRKSSTTTLAGLTLGKATMPDAVNYADTANDMNFTALGLTGAQGVTHDGNNHYTAMPVRFRRGDKLSETRYLTHNEGANDTTIHLFKNTQAIITENLIEDKKRSKSQTVTYASGNDMNEVRRTAAAFLTRSAKDLIRGKLNIVRYPFIELTGQAGDDTTDTQLEPTQVVGVYGGRPGMLVTKTDSDGEHLAGVLAEDINTSNDRIYGTLSRDETWSEDDYYKLYIYLRAGHSVRVSDPLSSVAANSIITKITFRETSSYSNTMLEVIGYQDLPTGSPVRPLGLINKAVVANKGDQAGPITLGKARLNQITFSSGDPS